MDIEKVFATVIYLLVYLVLVLAALAFTFFCIGGIESVHQDLDAGEASLMNTLGYDCILIVVMASLWIGVTLAIFVLREAFKQ